MLPEPKKVAGVIRKLLQSPEERRRAAEQERDVALRLGKARLRRHIGHQGELEARLKALARRALALNDEARFRQVGRQLLWTRTDIRRWEGYLLSLELLEARRDQAQASLELLQSIQTLSGSLAALEGVQVSGELQRELETGLARAASLEERMAVMMELVDVTLAGETALGGEGLADLEAELAGEIAGQEAAVFERQIEDGLRQIRSELENQAR